MNHKIEDLMQWSVMIGHGTGESAEITYRRAVEMGQLMFNDWLKSRERRELGLPPDCPPKADARARKWMAE